MSQSPYITYDESEWETREAFVATINAACQDLGVTCDWLSDSWIARFQRGDVVRFMHAYTFPVSNAATTLILRDKVATAAVLKNAGIPAIPHSLLRFTENFTIKDAPQQALALVPLPIVIKPNAGGSGGQGVTLCETKQELEQAIARLAARHNTLAVSPYTNIRHEYRVVVLHGKPKLIFEKLRQPGIWHHNLKRGAKPHVVTDEALRKKLEQFAIKALQAVGGTLAAVDIADTADGYQIMEINSGITLSRFMTNSPEYAALALAVYKDIIAASLN